MTMINAMTYPTIHTPKQLQLSRMERHKSYNMHGNGEFTTGHKGKKIQCRKENVDRVSCALKLSLTTAHHAGFLVLNAA